MVALIELKSSDDSLNIFEKFEGESMVVKGINRVENDPEEEGFYKQASELCDKGFGTFERCIQIMGVCKGNVQEAEKILSKFMLKENM